MKRTQLAHVLRAAAEISGEKSFVLVGRIYPKDANGYPIAVIEAWARRRQADALMEGKS